jgi:hypothetical protein
VNHLLKIEINTIPHSKQRYETVGDWFFKNGKLIINVSRMSDWRYEFLVAVHELVEVMCCMVSKVPQQDVDAFDIAFEMKRKPGNTDEPGDDPKAPYRVQHCIATGVERILASVLGVAWSQYDAEVNSL